MPPSPPPLLTLLRQKLNRFYADQAAAERHACRVFDVVERAMAGQSPWPARTADINLSFVNQALSRALDRAGLRAEKVSRRQGVRADQAFALSPTEAFDAMLDRQADRRDWLQLLPPAKNGQRVFFGGLKQPDADLVVNAIEQSYRLRNDGGPAEINRQDIVIRFVELHCLGLFAYADRLEDLVKACERAAIAGELVAAPGTFIVYGQ